jgi:uncharacterized protein (AIM24 family)
MPRKQSGGDAIPVPKTAGTGEPMINSQIIKNDVAVSSSSNTTAGITSGPYVNLGAKIDNINGYDVLKFSMAPNASVITNQETMSYMDGGLSTSATVGSSGVFGALLRGITGASFLQNSVVNPTGNTLKMVLSPLLQGSIIQIDIKAGETWRFADKSFMACTPNLNVSGNINIFSNFRLMFVGENLTYTTVSATTGPGSVWISSFGAIEKHEMAMGTGSTVPLFINNGCFLGMLDNNGAIDFWNDYVTVGTANGLFSAMFTQLGWVMKIQDTSPPRRPAPVQCTVLTQSLNPHNLEKYIAHIAQKVVDKSRTSTSSSYLTSGMGPGASSAVLGTATGVGLGMGMGSSGQAPVTEGSSGFNPAVAGLNTAAAAADTSAGMGVAAVNTSAGMNSTAAMNSSAGMNTSTQNTTSGGSRKARKTRARKTRKN